MNSAVGEAIFQRMNEFQPLIDQLYREEVQQARAMSPEERIALCIEMSEANIAWSHGAGDAELSRRLARLRQVRDARTYGPPQMRK